MKLKISLKLSLSASDGRVKLMSLTLIGAIRPASAHTEVKENYIYF